MEDISGRVKPLTCAFVRHSRDQVVRNTQDTFKKNGLILVILRWMKNAVVLRILKLRPSKVVVDVLRLLKYYTTCVVYDLSKKLYEGVFQN